MWKKEDQSPGAAPTAPPTAQPNENAPRTESPRGGAAHRERATIGPSISIRGDVTGDEDLLIQGRVDGSVILDAHAVTVGGQGRVKASITGRLITVEGHVEGDLTAQEQIILRGTAQVQGDVKAPRVVLEDGASFRGLVDMGAAPAPSEASSESGQAATGASGRGGRAETGSGKESQAASSQRASGTGQTQPRAGAEASSREGREGKETSGPTDRAGA